MKIIETVAALRDVQAVDGRCALVATMGNLHAGHLALVAQARRHGLPVLATIFVNRLQFAPHEDFDRYPRTLERDCDLLRNAGCDTVFAPAETELYPTPQRFRVQPDPALADIVEGEFRPGFFAGVCTIVMKLFGATQPAVAVFGKKDYQQLMVVRRLVEQFNLPVAIDAVETTRSDDGLALSSRNGYLSAAERIEAVALSRALRSLANAARTDSRPLATLESEALAALAARGWQPDYLTVRRREDLQLPTEDRHAAPLVALGAARLGPTRLIDNLEF